MAVPVINPNQTLNYGAMSLLELRKESLRLAIILDLVNSQRRKILQEIERRKATAKAVTRLDALTAMEREALRDELDKV